VLPYALGEKQALWDHHFAQFWFLRLVERRIATRLKLSQING
jgi:hypothetical protein